MTEAQNFIRVKILMGGRDGIMLSTDEINQLDWSVFDHVDVSKTSIAREDALSKMMGQIKKLRNP